MQMVVRFIDGHILHGMLEIIPNTGKTRFTRPCPSRRPNSSIGSCFYFLKFAKCSIWSTPHGLWRMNAVYLVSQIASLWSRTYSRLAQHLQQVDRIAFADTYTWWGISPACLLVNTKSQMATTTPTVLLCLWRCAFKHSIRGHLLDFCDAPPKVIQGINWSLIQGIQNIAISQNCF